MIKTFLIALLLTAALSQQVLQFEIYKSFANDLHDTQKINLGVLQVIRNNQINDISSTIRPNYPVLVSEQDLQRSPVILTFVPKKVKDVQHDNKVYRTSVVERLSGSHDEIIGVVVGVDMKIKAINYFEKRSPLQEIRAAVYQMEAGKEEIAKMELAPKKGGPQGGNPEQESFFSKYKWPIIIGIALIWLLSAADNKQGPAAGGVPQQR